MAEKKKEVNGTAERVKWENLENEYISTTISYKNLAQKHKISLRQIERYAREHNWVEKRRQFVGEVSANVRNAIIQNETNAVVGKLQSIATAADKLSSYILKAVEDDKQLYKRSFYDAGKGKLIEYQTTKIDGAALNQLVRSLDKLTDIIRDVNEIARSDGKKQDVEAEIIMPAEMGEFIG